jgi:hypothetical protein
MSCGSVPTGSSQNQQMALASRPVCQFLLACPEPAQHAPAPGVITWAHGMELEPPEPPRAAVMAPRNYLAPPAPPSASGGPSSQSRAEGQGGTAGRGCQSGISRGQLIAGDSRPRRPFPAGEPPRGGGIWDHQYRVLLAAIHHQHHQRPSSEGLKVRTPHFGEFLQSLSPGLLLHSRWCLPTDPLFMQPCLTHGPRRGLIRNGGDAGPLHSFSAPGPAAFRGCSSADPPAETRIATLLQGQANPFYRLAFAASRSFFSSLGGLDFCPPSKGRTHAGVFLPSPRYKWVGLFSHQRKGVPPHSLIKRTSAGLSGCAQ